MNPLNPYGHPQQHGYYNPGAYQPQHPQQQHPQQQQQQQQQGYGGPPVLPPIGSMSQPLPPLSQQPIHHQQSYMLQQQPQYAIQQVPQYQPVQQAVQPRQAEQPVVFSRSGRSDLYEYTLVVDQEPIRARMCGFGDKDRRPITPPPCIRLVIKDLKSGKTMGTEDVDGSFFVLQVDLWSDDARREVNIVRASSTSPAQSISTATTTSYPPTPDRASATSMYQMYGVGPATPYGPYPGAVPMPPTSNNSMFTRNLIGSLTVNATALKDLTGSYSYYFVLQDLSVRTEGHFRLKMNFIDISAGNGVLTKGRAPVLAHVFSEKFQVYSAKKFPGVIESTELSKCFAAQGIKIPIRKDNSRGDAKDEDDDERGKNSRRRADDLKAEARELRREKEEALELRNEKEKEMVPSVEELLADLEGIKYGVEDLNSHFTEALWYQWHYEQ